MTFFRPSALLCALILLPAAPYAAAQKPAPARRPAAPKAAPASYPPLPASVANMKLDDASGGMKSVSEFKGKVMLLTMTGRSEKDDGGTLSGDIGFAMAREPDFARAAIVTLDGYPGMLHRYILGRVEDAYRTGEKETDIRYRKHGMVAQPRNRNTVLVDFSGDAARKMGVLGHTDDTYQAYVLDRQQRIVLHLTQGQNHNSEARTRELITAAIRRELAKKR